MKSALTVFCKCDCACRNNTGVNMVVVVFLSRYRLHASRMGNGHGFIVTKRVALQVNLISPLVPNTLQQAICHI